MSISGKDPTTPPLPTSTGPAAAGWLRRAAAWALGHVKARRRQWAVAVFAFIVGFVGNEVLKAVVWEKIFPPKDPTGEVLAVNRLIIKQVGELRAVLLQRLDSCPTRAEDRAFLEAAVNTLAQNAGVLGQLNARLARGENISSIPYVAAIPLFDQ